MKLQNWLLISALLVGANVYAAKESAAKADEAATASVQKSEDSANKSAAEAKEAAENAAKAAQLAAQKAAQAVREVSRLSSRFSRVLGHRQRGRQQGIGSAGRNNREGETHHQQVAIASSSQPRIDRVLPVSVHD